MVFSASAVSVGPSWSLSFKMEGSDNVSDAELSNDKKSYAGIPEAIFVVREKILIFAPNFAPECSLGVILKSLEHNRTNCG